MDSSAKISNRTAIWQQMDNAHHLHPFSTHKELRKQGPRVITSAKGVYLEDSEGNRLLDGMAGLWCTNMGYGNDELAEAGAHALKELPYYNLFFQTTTPAAAELSAKIAEKTPGDLNQIFFACSGSEANDTGIKLVRYYWNLKGKKNRKIIVSRDLSYHGVTMGAASMAGLTGLHPQFDLPLPGFERVEPAPYYFREGKRHGMSEAEFLEHVVNATEQKFLDLGPENVAAFVAEPIMGAGGMVPPPDGYWPRIEALCRKYGILLWADEVICGWGRTGKWFGSQYYGFTPDIITMAKGLTSGYQPLSAVAVSDKIAQAFLDDNEEFCHGYTYSGHPVACAVALKNIELLERMDIEGAAYHARMEYFQQAIRGLSDHPIVAEVRGVGFLGALELVKDKETLEPFENEGATGTLARDLAMESGLVMRGVRDSMVLSPPLIITHSEIDELVRKIRSVFDEIACRHGIQ